MARSGGRRRGGSSRPKAKRRTKYLSLSRIIVKAEVGTPPEGHAPPAPPSLSPAVKKEDGAGHHQAEPFALHHELFAAVPAPSLSDILGDSPSPSASPDAASGAAGLLGAEEEDLPRRALRGRERWVYCSSSSSSSSSPSATTASSSSSPCSSAASTVASARSLLLKLDYEDILAAWAGRGSLYIADAAANTKPELDNVLVQVVETPPQHYAAAPCAWSTVGSSDRAERVRRYKQKRLNRLFAKRIRYEVRRVNAVTRPRFKGRFIKEREEIEVEPT